MSIATDAKLQAALEYAGYGWPVMQLGGDKGKKPLIVNWQHDASTDEETIATWWSESPGKNVGVQLGPRAGIIDIECDGDEAEKILVELFQGEIPVTPTFQSRRGKHRIFKWSDRLPHPDKNNFKIGQLEFRTGAGDKGAQSAFPPSVNEDGTVRQWIIHPSDHPPEILMDSVIARIHNMIAEPGGEPSRGKSPEHWKEVAKGISEGGRNETAASLTGKLIGLMKNPFNADEIEIIWVLVRSWNKNNTPPLPDRELATTFKSILTRHQHSRANSDHVEQVSPQRSFDPNGEMTPDWRLVIVESRPRVYQLSSPLWSLKAPHGHIELSSTEMHNPDAIRREALEQADTWVNRGFNKLWNGDKDQESLARKLIESATYVPAPVEAKRDAVVAELLWDQLSNAREADDAADMYGGVVRLTDGRYVLKFNKVWEPMSMCSDKVKRTELSRLLTQIGATDTWAGSESSRSRLKVLDADSIARLRKIITPSSRADVHVPCSDKPTQDNDMQ